MFQDIIEKYKTFLGIVSAILFALLHYDKIDAYVAVGILVGITLCLFLLFFWEKHGKNRRDKAGL